MKRMTWKALFTLAPLITIISLASFAQAEYVPPPSGPYESSVVIKSTVSSTDQPQQVYKFPPADLELELDERPVSDTAAGTMPPTAPAAPAPHATATSQGMPRQSVTVERPNVAAPMPNRSPVQAFTPGAQAQRQWQPGPSATGAPWPGGQQSYYPYQAYPYGYGYGYPDYRGSQYDDWGAPFGNMPSPWNMMRDNPFFSE